ncbi:MAG TPA: tetratricopeptide repeat protein, partial [Rhodocyclaceae bacterium]
VGGAAVWFALRPTEAPAPAISVAPTAPPPAPVAAPAAAEPVTAAAAPIDGSAPLAPAPPAESGPAPETAPARPTVPVAEAPALRMETTISQPPAKAATAAKAEPAKAESHAKAEIAATPARSVPAATPASAPATSRGTDLPRNNAAPQISKQPADASSANERADAEYRRGTTALRRGDAVESSEAFRAALRISPTHVPARQALLALLTEQQRWADAENLALDGVGLLPQRSDWALLSARLMYERGDASNALNVLDQYAANARQNADYQILRALLLMRAGRNADAADCYQTALAIRPQEGRWWFGLGRALDAEHREAQARQAYEKARDSGNLPPELQQAVERRLRQS